MDNVGGLFRIGILSVEELDRENHIRDRSKILDIPFIADTGMRKYERKRDKKGIYNEIKVTCKVARSDQEKLIDRFPEFYALITVDNNGVERVDGSRGEPMRCDIKSDTGEDYKDLNCVELEFKRKFRMVSGAI